MNEEVWDHETVMPSGKHVGKKLKDIPASHFIFLLDIYGIPPGPLKEYVKENEQLLREKYLQQKKQKNEKALLPPTD